MHPLFHSPIDAVPKANFWDILQISPNKQTATNVEIRELQEHWFVPAHLWRLDSSIERWKSFQYLTSGAFARAVCGVRGNKRRCAMT